MSLFHCLMAFSVDETTNAHLFLIFCIFHCGNFNTLSLMLWNFMAICLERVVCSFIPSSWVSEDLKCEGLMLLSSPGKPALIYFTISPIFFPLYLEHILVRSCNSWIRFFYLLCLSLSVPLLDFNFKFLLHLKLIFKIMFT